MALLINSQEVITTRDLKAAGPLDAKFVVKLLSDRDALPATSRYHLMMVGVQETQNYYTLKDAGDLTNSGWTSLFKSGKYLGTFNPTNPPAIPPKDNDDINFNFEDSYSVVVDGYWNFTLGDQTPDTGGDHVATLLLGETLIYNESGVWDVTFASSSVTSVNSVTGDIVLDYQVADIAVRDALTGVIQSAKVLVFDATADPIINRAVWAMYYWTGAEWILESTEDDVTYQSQLTETTATPTAVGGIPAGTTVADLANQSMSKLFDSLLFPLVLAYISANKSLSHTGVSGTTKEVGTAEAPTTVGTFGRGAITNGNGTAGPELVGLPGTWSFKLPNAVVDNAIASINLSESNTFASYNILKGSNIWSVEVDYDIGTGVYTDSKGTVSTNLDSSRVAGVSTRNTSTITGAYYFFYGFGPAPIDSVGVRAGIKVFLNQSNQGTFDFTLLDADTTIWFSTIGTPAYTVTQDPNGLPVDITGIFTDSVFNINDAGGTAVAYQTSEGVYGAQGHGDILIRVTI